MKTIFAILTVGLCLATTFGQIGWEIPVPVEGHPNECFVDDKFYKVNETWQLKGCGIGSCKEQETDGKVQLIVTTAYCGIVSAGEGGCTLVTHEELPHPKCCPEVECPEVQKDDSATEAVTESVTDIPSKPSSTEKPTTSSESSYTPIGGLLSRRR